MDKKLTFNVGYGASEPLRDAEAFEMFWHCEGMKTAFEGKVVLNGEEYIVSKEDSYGYADKNWGRDFTSPWVWLASSDLTSKTTGEKLKDSAFVIGGGRPKVGPVAMENKLLGAMWYEGEPFEFNFSLSDKAKWLDDIFELGKHSVSSDYRTIHGRLCWSSVCRIISQQAERIYFY